MSEIEYRGFGLVDHRVVRNPAVPRNVRLLYTILATYANAKNRITFDVTLDRLAREMDLARSKTAEAMAQAVEMGIVTTHRSKGRASRQLNDFRAVAPGPTVTPAVTPAVTQAVTEAVDPVETHSTRSHETVFPGRTAGERDGDSKFPESSGNFPEDSGSHIDDRQSPPGDWGSPPQGTHTVLGDNTQNTKTSSWPHADARGSVSKFSRWQLARVGRSDDLETATQIEQILENDLGWPLNYDTVAMILGMVVNGRDPQAVFNAARKHEAA